MNLSPENISFPWIPKNIKNLRFHLVPADGNCFFKSIQIILKSIGIDKSVSELRQIVAYPILKTDDFLIEATILNWKELYLNALQEGDWMLLEEYKHVKNVFNPNLKERLITLDQRKKLYHNMLSNQYWGEQHACRIIEEQTQLRFLIFNGDTKKPQLTWYQSSTFNPTHYCMLFVGGQHYMPVSWNNKFIFKWEELSNEIQLFFSQAYKTI